jgi:hypothetical protein
MNSYHRVVVAHGDRSIEADLPFRPAVGDALDIKISQEFRDVMNENEPDEPLPDEYPENGRYVVESVNHEMKAGVSSYGREREWLCWETTVHVVPAPKPEVTA